ncbi:NAD(P)/FAD-dependent oxidoreductase [Streptomyces sulphureus]|uniref:NAD(P)/FAD-dependent oxidoreductase n=1 Tax=Streptomyces sulphureus TaxID=47758 RepID=UPI00035C9DB0|nr:NAD(P)/FAD-dependent oxidoreductase [Streptomyces sulphureus]
MEQAKTKKRSSKGGAAEHDVIILGAGIAGSMLGAILARHGAKTLLIDAGAHPKFAVGESMVPYTLLTLRSVSRRYDVPEIATLSSFDDCMKNINSSFGWKKNFGFIRHEEGQEPNWWEATQFNTPGVFNKTGHLYRQDTDAHLFNVAVKYGAEPLLGYLVSEVDIDDDRVAVRGSDGSEHTARYLVDASGFRSPVAEKFGLREQPSRLRHHSRSIFSHMIGVKPSDDVFWHSDAQRPPVRWHDGTMHHLFDRGWFWVIPFNNNPHSSNPLCSVGVTMDERVYPKPDDMTAEEEFWSWVDKFPAVRRQFAEARSVREWVSTGRLQYSATSSVGPRWCLMSHAAGFIDPLFSRGISNTAEVINALSWRLLAALRDDEFTRERFEYVERLEQGLLDFNDALVRAAFISFDHYELWSAVFRIWAYGSVVGANRVQQAMTAAHRTRSDEPFLALEDPPHVGLWWPDHDEYRRVFDLMVQQTDAVDAGTVSPDQAAETLFAELKAADWMPPFMFPDVEHRFLRPTSKTLARMFSWAAFQAPAQVRGLFLGQAQEVGRSLAVGRKPF